MFIYPARKAKQNCIKNRMNVINGSIRDVDSRKRILIGHLNKHIKKESKLCAAVTTSFKDIWSMFAIEEEAKRFGLPRETELVRYYREIKELYELAGYDMEFYPDWEHYTTRIDIKWVD